MNNDIKTATMGPKNMAKILIIDIVSILAPLFLSQDGIYGLCIYTVVIYFIPPPGIEPGRTAPEAAALSVTLRGQKPVGFKSSCLIVCRWCVEIATVVKATSR